MEGYDRESYSSQGYLPGYLTTRSIIFDIRERLEIWRKSESLSLPKVCFLRRGDTTYSLRVWWKLPERSDRLTMLMIVGTRSAEHSLRSHVGIGSESHIVCWDS